MKPLYETALSTLDSTVSVPNYLPSVDTPDETARSPVGAPLLTMSPLCSAGGP
jgi:hypothetical protein